ncbi:MAG: hypothetical protein ACJ78Q_10305 [Chloroflexia bacterium]
MENLVNRHRNTFPGAIWAFFGTTLGLALVLAVGPLYTLANTMAPPDQGQGLNPLTIPVGGTANLTARGFCLDFGKPFPTDNTTTNGLADDKIRAALNYSI